MSSTFFRVEVVVGRALVRAVCIKTGELKSGLWHSKGQNKDGKVGDFRLVEAEVV
jgi:hypothetical protein